MLSFSSMSSALRLLSPPARGIFFHSLKREKQCYSYSSSLLYSPPCSEREKQPPRLLQQMHHSVHLPHTNKNSSLSLPLPLPLPLPLGRDSWSQKMRGSMKDSLLPSVPHVIEQIRMGVRKKTEEEEEGLILESLGKKLKDCPQNTLSYNDFIDLCKKHHHPSSQKHGIDHLIESLDESGTVLIAGNRVFLHPEQIQQQMEEVLMRGTTRSEERKELERLERELREIEGRAKKLAKRELWCGLGVVVVQSLGLFRLTFWDLSWDLMEPICFYLTSLYGLGAYALFMATSQEPSMEGLFSFRFNARRMALMRKHNFDLQSV
ncbi:calcium uniporter protein 4, mitochondrial-like isoform X2 [Amborella trichopoda]|uniref:calcium uniporter protein 4, mitochondrial-like isoform X2 n=1 Tax=Amborella trichopoda TaxID=13333 RepID=UPI0009BE8E24|nr:calcium uniporter protein 4, mitochondrial-like isoform X2 [Amborella trichopoda]|eukprot:XP_020526375.1 calcium uniporter protein 4, mitochondrial-like isoform X2 [Amborella trichopoda]